MSDAERRRYDEALEDMHEEIRRERRRSGLYRTRFSGHKAGYAAAGMRWRSQAARASSGLRRPFFSISQAAL
jgi:hypothetical protein